MPILCTLLLCSFAAIAQNPGRLEGRVVSTTGGPVAKATVRIAAQPAGASYVELTSTDGQFAVGNLAPGPYIVSAERDGYVPPPINRTTGWMNEHTFPVTAGQTRSGVEIQLMPFAVLEGSVIDADGEAVPTPDVSPRRYVFNSGRLTLEEPSPIRMNTDERGRFRAPNMPAGRYFVIAEGGGIAGFRPNEIRGASTLAENLPTYYPNSSALQGAQAIELRPGETTTINIRLLRGRRFAIRGTAIASTGAPAYAELRLLSKSGELVTAARSLSNTGVFEIHDVSPGDYTLFARTLPTREEPQFNRPAQPDPNLSTRLQIAVGGSDIENLNVRLTPGPEITGRVRMEAGPWPKTELGVLLLSLEPAVGQAYSKIASDGAFRIESAAPLKYGVIISPNPPAGTYIKSVRFGGQDVTRTPLDLTAGTGGVLEIVVSPRSASITGTVRDAKGDPMPVDTQVSVWPRIPFLSNPQGGIWSRTLDGSGSFRATGLPPGDYYAVAWEGAAPDYAAIHEFLGRFNTVAAKVVVSEGETATVEPKIISREAAEKEASQFP